METGTAQGDASLAGAVYGIYKGEELIDTTCPYPRYKDGSVIFCDVCIRRILDEQKEEKKRKEQSNE